jgi:methanogen homocitrate synthase
VGAERRIVLGKKSGLDSIELKCKELGVALLPEERAAVLAAVKQKGIEKRGLLTDEEFLAIVRARAKA